jgi:hypothetical protein
MSDHNYDASSDHDCDLLIGRVDDRFAPIIRGYGEMEKRAVYRYLLARKPKKNRPSLKKAHRQPV